jgi:hypothetical protein
LKEKLKYEAMELNFLEEKFQSKIASLIHFWVEKFPAKISPYYFFDDAC